MAADHSLSNGRRSTHRCRTRRTYGPVGERLLYANQVRAPLVLLEEHSAVSGHSGSTLRDVKVVVPVDITRIGAAAVQDFREQLSADRPPCPSLERASPPATVEDVVGRCAAGRSSSGYSIHGSPSPTSLAKPRSAVRWTSSTARRTRRGVRRPDANVLELALDRSRRGPRQRMGRPQRATDGPANRQPIRLMMMC